MWRCGQELEASRRWTPGSGGWLHWATSCRCCRAGKNPSRNPADRLPWVPRSRDPHPQPRDPRTHACMQPILKATFVEAGHAGCRLWAVHADEPCGDGLKGLQAAAVRGVAGEVPQLALRGVAVVVVTWGSAAWVVVGAVRCGVGCGRDKRWEGANSEEGVRAAAVLRAHTHTHEPHLYAPRRHGC